MTNNEPINLLEPQNLEAEDAKPKRKKLFWLFFIIVAIAVLATFFLRKNYALTEWPNEPQNYDLKTLKPKETSILQTVRNFIFNSENIMEGQKDDRINILLLGIGGLGHEGPYLSDTNIILSIKPSTNEVAMISVPRDLGVNIGNHGIRKINAADAFGEALEPGNGGEFTRQIFEKTFNMDIPYYVRVDFKAFQELIDEVGGISVDVPVAFSDSQFPGPNYSYRTLNFDAGVQTMNGQRALDFARSRHGNNGEGSDFARSRRQQLILTALKEKLLTFGTYTNPVKIQSIIQSLTSHIVTNLNFGQIMYLANLGKEAQQNIKLLVIDSGKSGFLKSYIGDTGAFLLAPTTNNFDQINLAIENVFEENKAKVAPNLSDENKPIFPTGKIQIFNGTWRVGLAAKYEKVLEEKGFSTLPPANSPRRPIGTTTIYLVNKSVSAEIMDSLKKDFNAPVTDNLPEWFVADSSSTPPTLTEGDLKYNEQADILIIIGTDLDIKP